MDVFFTGIKKMPFKGGIFYTKFACTQAIPFNFLIAAVSLGTTSNASPTMP